MILTFAICSFRSQTRLSFWEDSFTRVHESCNKHFIKFLMFVTLSTKWVTRGFGLHVRRRLCGTGGARRPTTPIPNQRTRASSVWKTSSFSFCQVDMYAFERLLSHNAQMPLHLSHSWKQQFAQVAFEGFLLIMRVQMPFQTAIGRNA